MNTAELSWIPQSNKQISAMQCGDEHDRETRLLEAQSKFLGRDRPRGMETGDGEVIEHAVPSVSGSCITTVAGEG